MTEKMMSDMTLFEYFAATFHPSYDVVSGGRGSYVERMVDLKIEFATQMMERLRGEDDSDSKNDT